MAFPQATLLKTPVAVILLPVVEATGMGERILEASTLR